MHEAVDNTPAVAVTSLLYGKIAERPTEQLHTEFYAVESAVAELPYSEPTYPDSAVVLNPTILEPVQAAHVVEGGPLVTDIVHEEPSDERAHNVETLADYPELAETLVSDDIEELDTEPVASYPILRIIESATITIVPEDLSEATEMPDQAPAPEAVETPPVMTELADKIAERRAAEPELAPELDALYDVIVQIRDGLLTAPDTSAELAETSQPQAREFLEIACRRLLVCLDEYQDEAHLQALVEQILQAPAPYLLDGTRERQYSRVRDIIRLAAQAVDHRPLLGRLALAPAA
jgi:hypothetical protein